jgi:hypothetical protein|tara:strand:+ start:292 stop:609 length:318 start_codon:yes stop_codon:yes gene_type:complete
MAIEFEVDNPEEFEMMVEEGDIRISKALVETILKNLKSKKNHHHALSITCLSEGETYDVTINKHDFQHTLENTLPKFEEEQLYEKCGEMLKAITYLKKNTKQKRR